MKKLLCDVVVLALAWLGFAHLCVRPYGWHAQYNDVYASLQRAQREEREALDGGRQEARELLERLNRGGSWALDVNYHVVRAEALRMLGRNEEAIATYEAALLYQRRPEIYTPLGLLQVRAGRREEGIRNLITAVRFNGSYGGDIDRSDVAEEIVARLGLK